MPNVGFVPCEVSVMTDHRLLRRYQAIVRNADELLDELGDGAVTADPAPAEAIALLDELSASLEPSVRMMADTAPDPGEVLRQLAGWVH